MQHKETRGRNGGSQPLPADIKCKKQFGTKRNHFSFGLNRPDAAPLYTARVTYRGGCSSEINLARASGHHARGWRLEVANGIRRWLDETAPPPPAFAGSYQRSPNRRKAAEIVGMDRRRRAPILHLLGRQFHVIEIVLIYEIDRTVGAG